MNINVGRAAPDGFREPKRGRKWWNKFEREEPVVAEAKPERQYVPRIDEEARISASAKRERSEVTVYGWALLVAILMPLWAYHRSSISGDWSLFAIACILSVAILPQVFKTKSLTEYAGTPIDEEEGQESKGKREE